MTITQRFYPKTIDAIFKQGDFFNPLEGLPPANVFAPVYVLLLKTDSGIVWDPERFEIFSSESDLISKSAYGKSTVISAQREGTKLKFIIPNQRWETSEINNIPFRHGIICLSNGSYPIYAFLHIDFGVEQNPTRGFEFNQNPSCMPHIDFEPIACGESAIPTEYDYSGAKTSTVSGQFTLVESPPVDELTWSGTINQTLMGEFDISIPA